MPAMRYMPAGAAILRERSGRNDRSEPIDQWWLGVTRWRSWPGVDPGRRMSALLGVRPGCWMSACLGGNAGPCGCAAEMGRGGSREEAMPEWEMSMRGMPAWSLRRGCRTGRDTGRPGMKRLWPSRVRGMSAGPG